MRSRGCLAVAVGFVLIGATIAGAAETTYVRAPDGWFGESAAGRYRVHPARITVRFEPGVHDFTSFCAHVGDADVAAIVDEIDVIRVNRLGYHDLRIPAGMDVFEVIERLEATGLVASAEPNSIGRYDGFESSGVDPLFVEQWALHNTGQTGGRPGADVSAHEAWVFETGDPSVIIAVIDSGTDVTHPDLSKNLWKNDGEIPGNGIDDDGNGFVDDYDGWDFGNQNGDVRGPFAHGTWVAGVIGAGRENRIGIAGLAGGTAISPGCRVMPLAVGEFSPVSDVIDDAILYATDHGARVITLSLSVLPTNAISDAIRYASERNVFIDCSVGNFLTAPGFPANHPLVLGVGATDHLDEVASFSSPGVGLDLVAPGEDIVTTSLDGAYATVSGTSFSSPLVAALAGLIISKRPCFSSNDVRFMIWSTVADLSGTGPDDATGAGRLDAGQALLETELSAECICRGDLDGNGDIGYTDLVLVLGAWGQTCTDCAEDLTGDGFVDSGDVFVLIATWGPCW